MSQKIGSRYVLRDVLGRGGFGTVWRADGQDGPVAVKVLRPELAEDPEVVARFVRERSVLLRVGHPNLVRVHDMVVEGDVLALVMDLVDGPTLREYLDDRGSLPQEEAIGLVADLASGLAAVHAKGVVHRDVKPANVLLAAAEHAPVPLLTDFGVAGLVDGSVLTNAKTVVGTPGYLAPELVRGDAVNSAADVYACGVLMYELVTGRSPFPADHPLAVIMRQANEEVSRPEEIPEPLWQVVSACLARQPERRPTSERLAEQLRGIAEAGRDGALTQILALRPTTRLISRHEIEAAGPSRGPARVTAPAPVATPVPSRRRLPSLLVTLAVAGIVVGGAAGFWLGRVTVSTDPSRPGPRTSYLDQLPVSQIENAQGPVGLGKAVGGEEPDDGAPLTMDNRVYEHGFGTFAPSHLRAYPNGTCTRFLATVGIDAEIGDEQGSSVAFQVLADGQAIYHSGTRTGHDPAIPVDLDITGAQVLDLVVTDAGDGNDSDRADWADARVVCAS